LIAIATTAATVPSTSAVTSPDPSESSDAKKVYVCDVYGYEYPNGTDEFEQLNDYICTICGAPKNKFKLQ